MVISSDNLEMADRNFLAHSYALICKVLIKNKRTNLLVRYCSNTKNSNKKMNVNLLDDSVRVDVLSVL